MERHTPVLSGEELYRRFLDGDEHAFERLVGLYRESLTRYINRFINDAREAEELMIDAFAELAVDSRYNERSSLKTYLFSIGRHIALRHIKKYKSKEHMPVEYARDIPYSNENTIEIDFIREEQREQLNKALRSLKQEYHEVLYLIYFENMSYSDAGTAMRKSEKQVTNLAHRAKASLKIILERGGAV